MKLLTLFLVIVSMAPAASYYVDFSTGDDNNAGTSEGAPWKYCPQDAGVTASSVAAGTTLAAGDTVYFKRGVTYVTQGMAAIQNGSSGNPITYDGETWGTGDRAIITNQHAATGRTAFDTGSFTHNYLSWRGIHFYQIGGYAEDDPYWETDVSNPIGGCAIDLTREVSAGPSNIIIDNCKFEEIGTWQAQYPNSGVNGISGTGIKGKNNSNVTITNCEFTKVKAGIQHSASAITVSNWLIEDCSFHNYINWGIDLFVAAAGATYNNIVVNRCQWYDYAQYNLSNWNAAGATGDGPHVDGIFYRTTGLASTWTNIVIKNSSFRGNDPTASGGTASIFLSQGASADIYNCLFIDDPMGNAAISVGFNKASGMTQVVRIWNCTAVGGGKTYKVTPTGDGSTANPDVFEIINCIGFMTGTGDNSPTLWIGKEFIGTWDINDNLYYSNSSNSSQFVLWATPTQYKSYADWVTYIEQETGTEYADPLFTDISSADRDLWDVTLQASSPAVGTGTDLSEHFTDDYNGNTRTTWDKGAIGYSLDSEPTEVSITNTRRLRANVSGF